MDIGSFHPMVVHFPIALFIAALAFDAVGVLWRQERFIAAALYVQALGALGAVVSVVSGNAAEEVSERIPHLEEVIEIHERLGQITMWAALAVVALRLFLVYRGRLGPPMRWLMLGFSLILAGLVASTGFYGGRMVYEFGAGVGPVLQQYPEEATR